MACMREMASLIGSWFAESRPRKKKGEWSTGRKLHKKTGIKEIFLPLIDLAICYSIDRFEQMCTVEAIFDLLCNQENLLRECEHNRLSTACQNL